MDTLDSRNIQDEVRYVGSRLRNTYLAAFSSLMYIIVLGMAASYPAPATIDMQKFGSRFVDITPDEITWIASLPTLSCGIGNCISGYISHTQGRRALLIFISVPYVLSWLMIAYAPSIAWIYCGRLLNGFCFGASAVAVPAYLVEIAPLKIRGLLTSGFQLAYTIGVFVMVTLGYVLRWSWLAISVATVVSVGACLMLLMPESPVWLVRESRKNEAISSLQFLIGKHIDTEKEFRAVLDSSADQPSITLRQFMDPRLYKPTIIAVFLVFIQQSSGINAVTSYTVEIFQNTGSSVDPQSSAVSFAVVQMVATVLSCLLMDKSGRRFLFISSAMLTTASLIVLGIYSYLLKYGYDLKGLHWIPLISILSYIAFFSLGIGPMPVVMTSEIVPIQSRSAVLTIMILSSSVFSFAVTKLFYFMVAQIGYYGLFCTYGFFTLLGTLFGLFYLPETKERTINDINNSFT